MNPVIRSPNLQMEEIPSTPELDFWDLLDTKLWENWSQCAEEESWDWLSPWQNGLEPSRPQNARGCVGSVA